MSETFSLTLCNMGGYRGRPKRPPKQGQGGQNKARPMQSKARTNKAYAKQGKGVFFGEAPLRGV